MLVTTHCLVLLGVFASLVLGGYWLAARLTLLSHGERLATSVLAGLSVYIWNVSVLGFIRPLSGPWLWLCLWPIVATIFSPRARTALRTDLNAIISAREGRVALVSFVLPLTALLWPLFIHPGMLFFDGTSNHDAFFWISGAEFLRDHTYMVEPVKSAVQPLTNGVGVFTGGWAPMWGRMSAEGLVALISGLTGIPTLQLYVAATVALFLPWIAAVYLVAKTFLARSLSSYAIITLCATQPLFAFFQANANLPNLLGCLNGALFLIATARCLRGPAAFNSWHTLSALGLHGLLCSYPEMTPFVLLSAGLLWSRTFFFPQYRRQRGQILLTGLAGLVLNPVTTVRAVSGFYRSFHAASVDAIWPKLFENLSPAEHVPALATLTLHTVDDAGLWLAGLCSLGLIATLIAVLRTAPDRFGAAATLAGPTLLFGYTLATHFSYGWQKVAQFGGVFLAAMLPVAAVNLVSATRNRRLPFLLSTGALAGLLIFFAYATGRNIYESHKWARRKFIGNDWLTIRDYARQHLQNATVRIDAPSFSAPYFYGMWSLYALNDTHPLFSQRGTDNGGYLHDYTRSEQQYPSEIPFAYFVSAGWADSFDANSPRLITGQTAALLSAGNRIDVLEGFSPKSGVPESASSRLVIRVTPHRASDLQFTLTPRSASPTRSTRWHVAITVNGRQPWLADISGAPPWHFKLPLTSATLNQIEIVAEGGTDSTPLPYGVTDLRITSSAEP